MKLATANIHDTLVADVAAEGLLRVLKRLPDVVCLQEWSRGRNYILRRLAGSLLVLFPRARQWLRRPYPNQGRVWVRPLRGGGPIGVSAEWGQIIRVWRITLSRRRRGVRASYATLVLVREHRTGIVHLFVNVHLLAHHNRPANLAAWRKGVDVIQQLARTWRALGFPVWVAGDVNKNKLELPPLVSCWTGREPDPTFRDRTIDGVWGPGEATTAQAFDAVPSDPDHFAVIAGYGQEVYAA